MCCQTGGRAGLGDEPWWKEDVLKLRQYFHESEDKAYGRERGFCSLWQTLNFPYRSIQRGDGLE